MTQLFCVLVNGCFATHIFWWGLLKSALSDWCGLSTLFYGSTRVFLHMWRSLLTIIVLIWMIRQVDYDWGNLPLKKVCHIFSKHFPSAFSSQLCKNSSIERWSCVSRVLEHCLNNARVRAPPKRRISALPVLYNWMLKSVSQGLIRLSSISSHSLLIHSPSPIPISRQAVGVSGQPEAHQPHEEEPLAGVCHQSPGLPHRSHRLLQLQPSQ